MDVNLCSIVAGHATRDPGRVALIDRDIDVRAGELDALGRRLATGLAQLGVGRGDRVAVWLPNVTAWIALFLACCRLGAIVVAVNTRFRSHEVGDIVGRSGAKVVVYWPGFRGIDFEAILRATDPAVLAAVERFVAYREVDAATAGSPARHPVVPFGELAAAAPMAIDHGDPDLGCVIFTTSGTTRAPKFVLHSQRTLAVHARDVVRGFGLDAADTRLLLTVPCCGVFGFAQAMASLVQGFPLVTTPAFDAADASAAIGRHAITHLIGSDTMVDQLLSAASDPVPFPGVRMCAYGIFSPALADIVERADRRGLRLVGLYGSSEAQALWSVQSLDAPVRDRMQGGGRPVSGEAAVRARDPESGRLLPHGVAGELELRGPSLMLGYYGNAAATAEARTADGWFRTGDLGHTLADGRFVYLARMGDSLRLGGFLVDPAEIEDVIQAIPGVAGCQVVGVEAGGQPRAFAFVLAQPGANVDGRAVIDHCAARLARFKVPVRVAQIEAFPTTQSANATKIRKASLRDLARESIERDPPG